MLPKLLTFRLYLNIKISVSLAEVADFIEPTLGGISPRGGGRPPVLRGERGAPRSASIKSVFKP
jgi:hypothetical protein